MSLVSVVASGYILTCEELEPGAQTENKYLEFVFLGLRYLSKYNII